MSKAICYGIWGDSVPGVLNKVDGLFQVSTFKWAFLINLTDIMLDKISFNIMHLEIIYGTSIHWLNVRTCVHWQHYNLHISEFYTETLWLGALSNSKTTFLFLLHIKQSNPSKLLKYNGGHPCLLIVMVVHYALNIEAFWEALWPGSFSNNQRPQFIKTVSISVQSNRNSSLTLFGSTNRACC